MSTEATKFDPLNLEDVSLRMEAIWDDEPDAYLVQRAGGDAEYLRLLRNHEIAMLKLHLIVITSSSSSMKKRRC